MRKLSRLAIAATVMLTLLASLRLGVAGAAEVGGVTRLAIGVVVDGVYRIEPGDLAQAGIDAAQVDPRTFAMNSLGRPVAILVTGEEDGHFDAGDAVLFFGEKFRGDLMAEKYTDERVYWLEFGGEPGPRIAESDATPTGDLTPVADLAANVHAEASNYWYTQHTPNPPTKDTWFWDELRPSSGTEVTRTYGHFVPYPANAEATIWVDQNARAVNDHHTYLSFDGVDLGETLWWGKTRSYVSRTIPAGALGHGENALTVRAVAVPDVRKDWVYFNDWELAYRRLPRAWQGQIEWTVETAGPHEYQIDGWDGDDVLVWDVTDLAEIKQLLGFTTEPGDVGTALRFRTEDRIGSRFWLQARSTIMQPASIRLRPPTGLRAPEGGADAVIVTSAELRPAAARLAAWHESHGRRALVADFQDVVDEFNQGIYHPGAVPAMLAWAQDHWAGAPPHYLTLVGDGHWNFKNFNPDRYPPQPNHIPPYLNWVDPEQGEVPTDAAYGDIDGDRKPDLAVGRLAVNTLAEAEAVVDKIIAYDDGARVQPWQRQALFVADNKEDFNDFPAMSDDIIAGYLPGDIQAQRIYLNETVPDAAAAKQAIIDGINRGAWMVQYTGHGAPAHWANENIWTLADIDQLRNDSMLPIVMTFNCLDGYFAYPDPNFFAIAEEMQRYPDGGSVAAISPSGLGYTFDQMRFRELLMQALFEDGVRPLGDVLLQAQRRFYDERGPHYLIDTMMLYGDPAIRVPASARALYLPSIMQ